MKNFKKILPAIALAGAGIIAIAGAGNASAYDYAQVLGQKDGQSALNPNNVEICYTISGIIAPITTTYTIPMEVATGSSIDLSKVSATSANDTTYSYSSSTGQGSFTITFDNESGTNGTAKKCVHLDFSNALDAAASFGNYTVNMRTPSSSNANAPIDATSGKTIQFGYQLLVNQTTKAPIMNASDVYQAEYWTKSEPSYESTITRVNTHIEVTKTVRGNAAIPVPGNTTGEDGFIFKARVIKTATFADTAYNIYVNGHTLKTCNFATSASDSSHDCEFRLNHNETAYIGCSSPTCNNGGTLPIDGVEYIITETDAKGHTAYFDNVETNSTGNAQVLDQLKSHAVVNEKTNTIAGRFFNILPFIILAILATVGVVTLRKANKKNEA